MPQISVIVPVYNVEKYIHRCVDSILTQTFRDFELILVDDGSPDNCGMICDEYAAKDSRVRVIHQENGGLSAARNAGIDVAVGKYIMFCDSDDYVALEWCERLLAAQLENPNAWIFCNVYRTNLNEKQDCVKEILLNNKVECLQTSYLDAFKMGLSGYSVNKIYSRESLVDNGIRFDVTCRYAEDVEFNVKYFQHCEKAMFLPLSLYFYVENPAGITGSYYANLFEKRLPQFATRIPLISEKEMRPFCDIWLYVFLHLFENVFDKRNAMSFWQKMRYNQKMIMTKEFQYCLAHASGEKENPVIIKLLKTKNYYIYWLFDRLVKLKRKIEGKL